MTSTPIRQENAAGTLSARLPTKKRQEEVRSLPLDLILLDSSPSPPAQTAFHVATSRSLLELSLDGNPVAGQNGLGSSYRRYVLHHLPGLRHLDLKRVTDHDQPFSKQQQQQQQRERGQQQQGNTMGMRNGGGIRGKSGFSEERSFAGESAAMSSGRPSTTDGVTYSSTNTNGSHGYHGTGDELPAIPRHYHHHSQHNSHLRQSSRHNRLDDSQPAGAERGHHHDHHRAPAAPGDTLGGGGGGGHGGDALRRVHHSHHSHSVAVAGGAPSPAQRTPAPAATAGDDTTTTTISSKDDPRHAAPGTFDGAMSRAAEAREAVAAKRSKVDKHERERRALRERREAIEAARCAQRVYEEQLSGARTAVVDNLYVAKLSRMSMETCDVFLVDNT